MGEFVTNEPSYGAVVGPIVALGVEQRRLFPVAYTARGLGVTRVWALYTCAPHENQTLEPRERRKAFKGRKNTGRDRPAHAHAHARTHANIHIYANKKERTRAHTGTHTKQK